MRTCFVLLALVLPAAADEGMWLFSQPPSAQIKERYGFDLTPEFLDHLRLSSIKLGGGSASFVSPDGLVFTNHHVAQRCVSRVSTPEHDYMKSGFFAATRANELRCPGMEGLVLLRIEDVTARVKGAVAGREAASDALARQRAAIAGIEKACAARAANRCDVVKLFSGERYDLYEYKRYTDLRLVFAPEFGMAFFGGDPDNFTYPRYDLDVTFLRAYEDGKPVHSTHYLKWSSLGVRDGELVFVSGSPGSTSRLATTAQLAFLRDTMYPPTQARLTATIAALNAYGAGSEENRRAAENAVFGAANTFKGNAGKFAGLRDASLMAKKQEAERKLRAAVEADAKFGHNAAKVWDEVAAAYKTWAPFETQYEVLERGAASGSSLLRIARTLVRLADEGAKPNDQRLPEYRDSARGSLELALYSRAKVTDSLEVVQLERYFEDLRATLGERDATVRSMLAGRTPRAAAEAYVGSSQLAAVDVRKQFAASREATAQSRDGMIRLARLLEEPARKIRKKHEEVVESLEVSAAARIASFRFRIFGANDYPDATGTPRLAFGMVKGYTDKSGTAVPWATMFGGLYSKATGEEPYRLPPNWVQAKGALLATRPLNFVSTADITGGNSGSPTVNSRGELVGIIFDSNLDALPNTFLYTDERARAVHVAAQGIIEALDKVYHAGSLTEELGVRSAAAQTN